MEILEHFQLTNTTLDINQIEDRHFQNEEEFFRLMACSISRLGLWALEIYPNAEKVLGAQNTQMIESFNSIFERLVNRSLILVDTDKSRIAIPIMDFLT